MSWPMVRRGEAHPRERRARARPRAASTYILTNSLPAKRITHPPRRNASRADRVRIAGNGGASTAAARRPGAVEAVGKHACDAPDYAAPRPTSQDCTHHRRSAPSSAAIRFAGRQPRGAGAGPQCEAPSFKLKVLSRRASCMGPLPPHLGAAAHRWAAGRGSNANGRGCVWTSSAGAGAGVHATGAASRARGLEGEGPTSAGRAENDG